MSQEERPLAVALEPAVTGRQRTSCAKDGWQTTAQNGPGFASWTVPFRSGFHDRPGSSPGGHHHRRCQLPVVSCQLYSSPCSSRGGDRRRVHLSAKRIENRARVPLLPTSRPVHFSTGEKRGKIAKKCSWIPGNPHDLERLETTERRVRVCTYVGI
jgi:hypothetical protein